MGKTMHDILNPSITSDDLSLKLAVSLLARGVQEHVVDLLLPVFRDAIGKIRSEPGPRLLQYSSRERSTGEDGVVGETFMVSDKLFLDKVPWAFALESLSFVERFQCVGARYLEITKDGWWMVKFYSPSHLSVMYSLYEVCRGGCSNGS